MKPKSLYVEWKVVILYPSQELQWTACKVCLLLVSAAEGSPKTASCFNTIYKKTFKSMLKKEIPKRGFWWMESLMYFLFLGMGMEKSYQFFPRLMCKFGPEGDIKKWAMVVQLVHDSTHHSDMTSWLCELRS